eukprot:9122447-Alexandrium_andersonii.AAC.1
MCPHQGAHRGTHPTEDPNSSNPLALEQQDMTQGHCVFIPPLSRTVAQLRTSADPSFSTSIDCSIVHSSTRPGEKIT